MSHTSTSGNTQGIFPRAFAWLFGPQARRLSEQASRTHWLSYLLIIAQSVAVVLVFGHAEVGLLLSPNVAVQVMAGLALFVLVITVIAADLALLETLTRIPALARNRQTAMLREHIAYVLFVLAVEGSTYGVVLYTLDSDPQALVRSAPLIPTAGPVFLGLVIMRVLLICWSAVQLIIVRGKLPVLLSTLTNTGKEIVGAHVERQLEALDISDVALPDTFAVYAAMAKPPRPIKRIFNGWAVRRALDQEAEEARQVSNVLSALESLEARRTLTLPAPELPPDMTPPDDPHNGPHGAGSDDDTQGGRDDFSYLPPVPMLSGLTPFQPSSLPVHHTSGNGRRPVARNQARKRVGKVAGKSSGKRMLTYAQRNHQRVVEVREWLTAGETVSKQRIRKAFGVDNRRAGEILATAQQRALHAV